MSSEAEKRILDRARLLLGARDVSSARLLLERIVETGSAEAAYLLGRTYDPAVLDQWRIVGWAGDETKARELYARAAARGYTAPSARADGSTPR
jgi:TPR repeat protein